MTPGQVWRKPVYWPVGARHGGDASLICCIRVERGKVGPDNPAWQGWGEGVSRDGCNREGLSTDAGSAGGPACSNDEAPVMGVELVNMNVRDGAAMLGGGLVDCGAVREMEVLALQSRLAEEGSKPPRGALAEDRGLERRRKRRGEGPRQVWTGKMSDEREFSVVDVSKPIQLTSKPGLAPCSGKNLGDIRLLPRWCPAYRQHEPGLGFRMEHVKA